jgi:hypothetical protein
MKFTVEVGVASEYLWKSSGDSEYFPYPPRHTGMCSVGIRLGWFSNPPGDKWWTITWMDREELLDSIAAEILDLLKTRGLPLLEKSVTDEGLSGGRP